MLPKLLTEAGGTVTALSPSLVGASSHVASYLPGPSEPDESAAMLLELLARKHFDWVILSDEPLMEALLRVPDRSLLQPWFPVEPFNDDVAQMLLSKDRFIEVARRAEIPVPETYLAETLWDCVGYARLLGYPVVLKGRFGYGGDVVHIVDDEHSLESVAALMLAREERIVVQRRLSGDRFMASVVYRRGIPLGYNFFRAQCCLPDDSGFSTQHEPATSPQIDGIVRAIGAVTAFNGFANIDFMSDAEGRLYVLEINPRPSIAFGGTAATRRFFRPIVRDYIEDRSARTAVWTDLKRLSYFPIFAFYFIRRANKTKIQNYRDLLSSFGEFRLDEWRVSASLLRGFLSNYADTTVAWRNVRAVFRSARKASRRLSSALAKLRGKRGRLPPGNVADR